MTLESRSCWNSNEEVVPGTEGFQCYLPVVLIEHPFLKSVRTTSEMGLLT